MDGYSRGSLSCFSIQRWVCLLLCVVVIVMNNVNYFTSVIVFLVVFVIFSQVNPIAFFALNWCMLLVFSITLGFLSFFYHSRFLSDA